MSKDHARLTVLLDADRKKAFEDVCKILGTNASEVVRALIAQYLASDQPEPSLIVLKSVSKAEPSKPGK